MTWGGDPQAIWVGAIMYRGACIKVPNKRILGLLYILVYAAVYGRVCCYVCDVSASL